MQFKTFNNMHTKTYNRFLRGQKRSSTIGTRVYNTLSGPKPSLKTLMRPLSSLYYLRKAGTPKRRSRRYSRRHSRRHSRRNSRRH